MTSLSHITQYFNCVKDCVVVDDGAVVTDDTVMPPFTRWAGRPAKVVTNVLTNVLTIQAGGV